MEKICLLFVIFSNGCLRWTLYFCTFCYLLVQWQISWSKQGRLRACYFSRMKASVEIWCFCSTKDICGPGCHAEAKLNCFSLLPQYKSRQATFLTVLWKCWYSLLVLQQDTFVVYLPNHDFTEELIFREWNVLRKFDAFFYKRHLWPRFPCWNKIKLLFTSVPTQEKTSNLLTVLWKYWYPLFVFQQDTSVVYLPKHDFRRRTNFNSLSRSRQQWQNVFGEYFF